MRTHPSKSNVKALCLKRGLQYRRDVSSNQGGYLDTSHEKRRLSAENRRTSEGDAVVAEEEHRHLKEEDKQAQGHDSDEWVMGDVRKITDGDAEGKEGSSKVEDGLVRFMIGGEWRQVPCKFWAYRPRAQCTTYPRCTSYLCKNIDDCRHPDEEKFPKDHHYTDWIPELLCDPGSVPIGHVSRSMPPRSSLSRFDERYGATALGARIPPELFPLLYGWVDSELARKCRLVCRYWEKQCRPRAFASIDLKGREKRVLDLVHFKYEPAWRHIPPLVKEITDVGVPYYTDKSKAPWLHLVNPRWIKKWPIQLVGPFPGRPTIRSIHFALPRSPPPSFSRGITALMLENVSFRHFEDTACLVSELPDLGELWLKRVKWESLPNRLPRRRPRSDRNNLHKIDFRDGNVKGAESPSFFFATFALFLNAYSVSSFFSVDVATAVDAVLRIVHSEPSFFQTILDPVRNTSGAANVGFYDILSDLFLAFCTPGRDSSGNSIISVLIDLDHEDVKFVDHSSDAWIHLNAVIATLPQRLQFLFGFQDRERMTCFAAAVVNEKLPSLLRRGKARYAIARKERREEDYKEHKYWYQATLESDELHGDGTKELRKAWA